MKLSENEERRELAKERRDFKMNLRNHLLHFISICHKNDISMQLEFELKLLSYKDSHGLFEIRDHIIYKEVEDRLTKKKDELLTYVNDVYIEGTLSDRAFLFDLSQEYILCVTEYLKQYQTN